MFWQNLTITFIAGVFVELISLLLKKSTLLTSPFWRLLNETVYLCKILNNKRFSVWKPKAARYVALHAIKSQETNQENAKPVLDILKSNFRPQQNTHKFNKNSPGKICSAN